MLDSVGHWHWPDLLVLSFQHRIRSHDKVLGTRISESFLWTFGRERKLAFVTTQIRARLLFTEDSGLAFLPRKEVFSKQISSPHWMNPGLAFHPGHILPRFVRKWWETLTRTHVPRQEAACMLALLSLSLYHDYGAARPGKLLRLRSGPPRCIACHISVLIVRVSQWDRNRNRTHQLVQLSYWWIWPFLPSQGQMLHLMSSLLRLKLCNKSRSTWPALLCWSASSVHKVFHFPDESVTRYKAKRQTPKHRTPNAEDVFSLPSRGNEKFETEHTREERGRPGNMLLQPFWLHIQNVCCQCALEQVHSRRLITDVEYRDTQGALKQHSLGFTHREREGESCVQMSHSKTYNTRSIQSCCACWIQTWS